MGSEMCIRDRPLHIPSSTAVLPATRSASCMMFPWQAKFRISSGDGRKNGMTRWGSYHPNKNKCILSTNIAQGAKSRASPGRKSSVQSLYEGSISTLRYENTSVFSTMSSISYVIVFVGSSAVVMLPLGNSFKSMLSGSALR